MCVCVCVIVFKCVCVCVCYIYTYVSFFRSFCVAHKDVDGHSVLLEMSKAKEQQLSSSSASGSGGGGGGGVSSSSSEGNGGGGRFGYIRVCSSIKLGRRLAMHEEEVLLYPPLCEVCGGVGGKVGVGVGRVKEGVGRFKGGVSCIHCHCVYYCSHAHRIQDAHAHARWCAEYRLCVLCDALPARDAEVMAMSLPPTLDREYRPLPPSITDHLQAIAGEEDPLAHLARLPLLSHTLSFPLTAVYALQQGVAGLAGRTSLTVHVVGAEHGREPLGTAVWEYVMHRLPNLTSLYVLMVGPQINDSTPAPTPTPAALCPPCQARGRVMVVESRQALYHTIPKGSAAPDLRLAFNCGFHECSGLPDDTWPLSLPIMVGDGAPLAFTSYSRAEGGRDLEAVRACVRVCVRVLQAGTNPYRSLRPLRNWTREDGEELYHVNQDLTVVVMDQD